MPWTRQLPSGLWASTVYTPNGRRTKTHRLQGSVERWAADLEADIRRGEFVDPQLARKTVAQIRREFGASRKLELASRKKDDSIWKNWVEPRWGSVPSGLILKPHVQGWVNELEEDNVGAWVVIAALNCLKAMLELGVDAGWLRANAARRVKPPVPPKHEDRLILPEEERAIMSRADDLFPDRRDAAPFIGSLFELGTRWEETAAIRREMWHLRGPKTGLVTIGPVMERDGRIREYPKGARDQHDAGWRDVPVGDEWQARMRPLVLATPPGGIVFTASQGGSMLYPTWLRRVWNPVLRVPIVNAEGKPTGEWEPLVEEPMPTPHDCRHKYGSDLADAGVELHDRMALMGHQDVRSGQRYTHSGASRFAAARAARRRATGS